MNVTFLSGLPRTGSTLLTSVLNQNPSIYAGANSALCQTMWDLQVSCWNSEQLDNNLELEAKLISSIPNVFYEEIDKNIVDKCRSWTLPANLDLINKYITKSPKIIVMTRPIIDIVKSFVFIRQMNGWANPEMGLLDDESEPIMRSLNGVIHAKSINTGQFLFIEYDDLIESPQKTIDKIYDFCEWDKFEHNFSNVINQYPENDVALNMNGLHDIRKEFGRRKLDIKLSKETRLKAISLRY